MRRYVLLSFAVGFLVGLPLVAAAQGLDAVADASMFLARFAGAAALITAVVLFARGSPLRRWLAPSPSTHLSKALCRALALVVGLVLGLVGIVDPMAPGVAGELASGLLAAALAVYGRDLLVSGWRAATSSDPDADPPEVQNARLRGDLPERPAGVPRPPSTPPPSGGMPGAGS